MKAKPIVAGVLLIAAVLGAGGGLAWWKFRANRLAAAAPGTEPPTFVETAVAETVSWRPTSRLVGTVIAKRSVTVANEIVGVVNEVGFDSGDTVRKGQVLLKLDTATELADLAGAQAAERLSLAAIEAARANIRVAQSNLDLAISNQKRFQEAAEAKSVAAAELDRANAEVDKGRADLEREQSSVSKAQAELDQARARIQQIQTTINKKTLLAPFDARAGMRTVHPGQYLAEGTSIVGLTELTDDIYLDFAVPQEYAARVTPGAVVVAKSAMLGSDAAQITVVSIDATVNPVTRNVRVRSSVPNPGHRLKPGMFIDVEVPVDAAREFVAIPATAVRRAAYGTHVLVLVPGDPEKDPPGASRARQRMVELGPDVGGKVIVLSGLQAGEQVAAAGSFKLREGGLVLAAPPPGDPAQQPAPPSDEKAHR